MVYVAIVDGGLGSAVLYALYKPNSKNDDTKINQILAENNYETFEEAKLAIFEFIESWYNNKRIHSTMGYITPNEKYNNYIANLAIA